MMQVRAHPLLTVFVLALIVRLINVALLHGENAFFAESDATKFWLMAAELAQPSSFWPKLTSMTDRMPIYLVLLAGLRATARDAPRAGAATGAALSLRLCSRSRRRRP